LPLVLVTIIEILHCHFEEFLADETHPPPGIVQEDFSSTRPGSDLYSEARRSKHLISMLSLVSLRALFWFTWEKSILI
jgi:hypothetical protein